MSKLIGKYVYTNYVVQAINAGVNFVYSLVIVHLLGAAGYGEYAIFNNSLAFTVLLLGFNFPSAIVFFVANKKIDGTKLLYSFLAISLGIALLLVFVLANSKAWGFSSHIFPGGENKAIWIFFFAVLFFLLQCNQLLTAYLNAQKVFIPVAIFSGVSNIALLLFLILFLSRIFTISISMFNMVWWLTIILNGITVLYSVYLISKLPGVGKRFKVAEFSELRMITGFTLVVYACNTIQFLNYKMDIWFVNYFRMEADTGLYALALALSQLIWVLPNAISSVLLNYYQVDERKNGVDLAMQYGSLTLYGSLLTAVILSVIYYFALPVFYGEQFDKVFRLCIVLFAGTVPFSLAIIIIANLNSGIGFVKINLYATIFTFVVGIVLDLVLIPVYGIWGATIAKVIIYLVGLVFHIIVGSFLYNLPWLRLLKWPRVKDLIAITAINK